MTDAKPEPAARFKLSMRVNGANVELDVPPLARLLDVLRDELRLTGTKEGCGEGECGACAVLIGGECVLSCLVPACQAAGCDIITVEDGGHRDIQRAFLDEGGAQCGICTPGMIVTTRAWLAECEREGRTVTLEGAREALAGNLCRCTGYGMILAAVLAAARKRANGASA